MQLNDLTVTYDISGDGPLPTLSLIAHFCNLAQITPVNITFSDTNVSIEFSNRDDAVRYTEEYFGSSEGVSEYIDG